MIYNNEYQFVVCICTWNNDSFLLKCIKSVESSLVSSGIKDVCVVIIDNNTEPRMDSFLKDTSFKIPLFHSWEQTAGIPFARNHAIDIALDYDPEYIIFLDDDQIVELSWFQSFVTEINNIDCDIISGHVIQKYRDLTIGPKRNIKHHSSRKFAETDNILIKSAVVKDLRFDTRLAQCVVLILYSFSMQFL